MPRGKPSTDGSTRISDNGYHYTKVDGKWKLTHHIEAEAKLGRPIYVHERVYFKDRNKTNFDPDNIMVLSSGTEKLKARHAALQTQIRNLQEELARVERDLEIIESKETSR
jgi:hypothetical protein